MVLRNVGIPYHITVRCHNPEDRDLKYTIMVKVKLSLCLTKNHAMKTYFLLN